MLARASMSLDHPQPVHVAQIGLEPPFGSSARVDLLDGAIQTPTRWPAVALRKVFCPLFAAIVHFLIQVKPPTNAKGNDGVSLLSRRKRLMASENLPLILAIGAAGKFAGMVVPELAKHGANVRGFVRRSDEIEVVKAAGAEDVIVGDLTDKAGVRRAMEGVGRVFYIAPAFLPNEAEVGVAVVGAAKDASVKRFVFSSVIHPVLGELANHAAKAPVEDAALSSGLEYTFLHPTLFFQNFADSWSKIVKGGVLAEPWSVDTRFSRVDYRDVAEAAAIALTEDRLLYGTFELCAEGRLNRKDVAAIIGEVPGRSIRAQRIDPKAAAARAGPAAPALEKMFDRYDRRGLQGNALTLRAILGREPRTLRGFFAELAAAGNAEHSAASGKAA
jgi:uncharacterized protein YbjT (DUF2867 family)